VTHPSKVIGRVRHQDDPGQVDDVAVLHGAAFVTSVQADEPEVRHQDGPVDIRTLRHQDDSGPLTPVSFVSDEDRELAAGPHYRAIYEAGDALPAPPDPPIPTQRPLPPAPSSHLSWWSRRECRERLVAGADAEVAG
jgi:hypothetical protein